MLYMSLMWKGGRNQQSPFSALFGDCSGLEHIYSTHTDSMGHAQQHHGNVVMLEQGRRSVSEKKRWGMIPACIWWTLWNERNSRCFEDNANSIQKIKMNCLLLFHFWCKLEYIEDSEAIIDALGSL